MHRPFNGDGKLIIGLQDVDESLSAGGADGPQRVGAALQLGYGQVFMCIGLKKWHNLLTGKHTTADRTVIGSLLYCMSLLFCKAPRDNVNVKGAW